MKTCFISYSYDSPDHSKWVERFAKRLRAVGIATQFDALDTHLGDDLVTYMVEAVQKSDRVILICTPKYHKKMSGGAAFEKMLIAGELGKSAFTNKFIPVLREGDKASAIPAFLHTKRYLPMFGTRIKSTDVEQIAKAIGIRGKPVKKKTTGRKSAPTSQHNKHNNVGRIRVVGYRLLGGRGSDGIGYLWQGDNRRYTESLAFNSRIKAYEIANSDKRISAYTTSVSFGCQLSSMGIPCAFCATGRIKFYGNLTAEEIALQNIFMAEYDSDCPSWPEVRDHSREFAFMGQGEPGFAYPQIRRAIILTDEAMSRIKQQVHRYVISSAGVPEMLDLLIADFKTGTFKNRVTVHFSLHAIAPQRSTIMPLDALYPYVLYLKRAKKLFEYTDEKMAVGILLFDHFSSTYLPNKQFTITDTYLERILDTLDPKYHRVDLCDVNLNRSIKSQGQVSNERARRLLSLVTNRGFDAKLFSSFGAEDNSGCGMLKASKVKIQKPGTTTLQHFDKASQLLSDVLADEG